jgi:hypothetical protein
LPSVGNDFQYSICRSQIALNNQVSYHCEVNGFEKVSDEGAGILLVTLVRWLS